ncbi:MAG TPA: two-component regulator propeller domain-containing protein [Thermoanaerobaculia bacterium]|nr:two-component regulator propeller domain-containing protein [Thermoanaerobaculia bacterium]
MRILRLSIAALLLLAGAAFGLDPRNAITQYAHTAWRVRDGHFAGAPSVLAQTSDGFLWIGTQTGLVRFDGVRFTPWEPPPGSRLPDDRIIDLLATRDGSLWIGTANGLARWHGSKLTVYARLGRFDALLEDHRGVVWVGHTRALEEVPPLCRFERERFQCFRFPDRDRLHYVGSLSEDRQGDLWIGGEMGVCRWRAEGLDCHEIESLAPLAGKAGVFGMAIGSDGTLWAGTGSTGVWQLRAGHWTSYPAPTERALNASTLLADREGSLWIGLEEGGLIRQTQGRTDRFLREDGLSGEAINSLFEDREGSLWVATAAGLDRFRDVKVVTLTPREGLPGGYFSAIAAARDGGVWISERRTLLRLKPSGISSEGVSQGLPGISPNSIFEDSRGRLWLGVDNGLAWRDQGRFFPVRMPDGGAVGIVCSMAEDREGNLWVTTTSPDHNLVRVRDGRVVQAFSTAQLGRQQATYVAADPKGGLWISLSGGKLMRWRDGSFEAHGEIGDASGRWVRSLHPDPRGLWAVTNHGLSLVGTGKPETLDVRNGLPCDDLEDMLPGEAGSLWIKASCGLFQIAAAELDAWEQHPERRVRIRVLDTADGVQAGLSPFTPRAAKSLDGRLWFTLEGTGVQVLDPKDLRDNPLPPPVQILRIVADRKVYPPAPRLRLPPLTRELEIDYTALSLAVPEKVLFRYRLVGAESDWQDAGTRREAFYTNLSPGNYEFRVIACNNDGVWSSGGATLAFTLRPAFYQTRWFLALCALTLAALVGSVFGWRVRQVRIRLAHRFEERLAERTRIAQDLHDTLLQGFLSASMQLYAAVEELPPEERAKGRFERVQQLMRQVIDEGRAALRGLRAPDAVANDLEPSLARVPAELGSQGEVKFRVVVEGRARPLAPVVRDEIYRISREALVNAFQHAGAAAVEVEIEYAARQLRVVVRDDGKGIDPEILRAGREDHWGLSGMRERAERIGARLQVWSRDGAGTEVELAVPGKVAYAPSSGGWET